MTDEIRILLETEDYIVVDKDRFLAVHGGKGLPPEKTLLFRLRMFLSGRDGASPDDLRPVHRLDLNTRGPVIFSKNLRMFERLTEMFRSGKVRKTYEVLIEGRLEKAVFLEADLIKTSHRRAVVKNLKSSESVPDREEWTAQKFSASTTISATVLFPVEPRGENTLSRVELWTGRYHQIRAVCEAAGHPVCGDTLYNHSPAHRNARYTDAAFSDGQMLLCRSIEIPDMGLRAVSGYEL